MATKLPDPATPLPVKLLKVHTHEGVHRAVGDTIHLLPDQIAWLASQGVVAANPIKE